jgi:hypothetical protein
MSCQSSADSITDRWSALYLHLQMVHGAWMGPLEVLVDYSSHLHVQVRVWWENLDCCHGGQQYFGALDYWRPWWHDYWESHAQYLHLKLSPF